MSRHAWTGVLCSVGFVACSGSPDSGDPSTRDKGQTGSLAGDHDCEVVSTEPVAFTKETALGIPAEVFSQVAGTCTAPFRWDGSGWTTELTVTPATGESTLTATVDLDPSSARWVTRRRGSTASMDPNSCGPQLEIDATVTLKLPDGVVAGARATTLTVTNPQAPLRVDVSVERKDFGSWVSVEPSDPAASVKMAIELSPIAKACEGRITLVTERASGSSGGSAATGIGMAQGDFATWSQTGCDFGQTFVDLDQPFQGVDLAAAVTGAFGQVEFTGTWEDGGTTALALQTTIPTKSVCTYSAGNSASTVVPIPIDLVATTADGRINALSGRGSVRATLRSASLSQLELWLSTDLVCASETDVLPYRTPDCARVTLVTAQLGFHHYTSTPEQDGGRLELYVYNRNSTGPAGGADRVDRLILVE